MEQRLEKIFTELFGIKIKKTSDVVQKKISKWDSINHLKLIMAIESEFGTQFSTNDIPKMISYDLILEKLKESAFEPPSVL